MTAAATNPSQATPGDPPAWEALRGVRAFSAGTNWDGHPLGALTEADLRDVVRNFHQLRGFIDPPLWHGHEADLKDTGLPAYGWVSNAYLDGRDLVLDVDYVDPDVADKVRRKKYRKVSVEFYTPQQTGRGYALKRVGILGAHLPACKSTGSLPDPEPMDPARAAHWPSVLKTVARNFTDDKTVRFFSEVEPMNREQMVARLKELGYGDDDFALFEGKPDDAVAAFLTRAEARHKPPAPEPPAPAPAPATTPAAVHPPAPAPVPTPALTPAEMLRQFSELQAALPTLRGQLDGLNQLARQQQQATQQRIAAEHRAGVESRLAQRVKEGRLSPAQVEPGRGPFRLLAEKLDGVRQFADQPSPLELLDAALDSLPARRFSEQLPDPVDAGGFADLDKQVDAYAARRNGKAVN